MLKCSKTNLSITSYFKTKEKKKITTKIESIRKGLKLKTKTKSS